MTEAEARAVYEFQLAELEQKRVDPQVTIEALRALVEALLAARVCPCTTCSPP